jgi:N-acetylmuramoyl-L-alanine amidase
MILQKAYQLLFVLVVLVLSFIPIHGSYANNTTRINNSTDIDWDIQNRLQKYGLYQNLTSISGGEVDQLNSINLDDINNMTINNVVNSQTKSLPDNNEYTKKEIRMIAQMVYGEARGESIKGQVAVASVIINRVQSDKFPNTVQNVLFQNGAFTAINDGQYYNTPDLNATQAVYYAIEGVDPTKDALYYFNPDIATSDWIWSRAKTVEIGEHIFAK